MQKLNKEEKHIKSWKKAIKRQYKKIYRYEERQNLEQAKIDKKYEQLINEIKQYF